MAHWLSFWNAETRRRNGQLEGQALGRVWVPWAERKLGIGDILYPVGIEGGELMLIGRVEIGELEVPGAADEQVDVEPVSGSGVEARFDRQLDPEVTDALEFWTASQTVRHIKRDDQRRVIGGQFQGRASLRELVRGSELLDRALEAPQTTRRSPAATEPTDEPVAHRWLIKAHTDPYEALADTREEGPLIYGGWTVPKQARLGDLLLFYGTDPYKEFGYVGRVCSPQTVVGRDGRYWAHIEVAPCEYPLPLADARQDAIIGGWSGVHNLKGLSASVPAQVWEAFVGRLAARDAELRATLEEWAEYPPLPELDSLAGEEWAADELPYSFELGLQSQLRTHLSERSQPWREPRPGEIAINISGYLGAAGFADIALVGRHDYRVLVIEVKLDARTSRGIEGIDQVRRYRDELRRRHADRRIEAWIAAQGFSPPVLDYAQAHDVVPHLIQRDPDGQLTVTRAEQSRNA